MQGTRGSKRQAGKAIDKEVPTKRPTQTPCNKSLAPEGTWAFSHGRFHMGDFI
jgi:hypothetical protein